VARFIKIQLFTITITKTQYRHYMASIVNDLQLMIYLFASCISIPSFPILYFIISSSTV